MSIRTSISKRRAQVLQEYHDPLQYMDARTVRRLRIMYVIIALACIAVGCAIWWAFIFGSHTSHDTMGRWMGGGFMLVTLAIFLPPYGLFRLFTIKRSIIAYRRRQLARNAIPNTKPKN